ncbi:MAG: hypothetical protein GXP19_07870 [Gammaproteobacteria bacterium]|nr:hypothetical protein [Gammaproteobacteria bacterium]
MSLEKRTEGGKIVNAILQDSLEKHQKHIRSADWLPSLDKEPNTVNFESYLLVIDLGDEKLDLGFSKNDLEGISKDKYIRENTEKYIDKLISKI